MATRGVLIALDSVGIDPLGHDRPDSVYAQSEFLFPRGRQGEVLELSAGPRPGALVQTDVTDGAERGAIECAITYTSIFSGESAVQRHGLMQGLGLKDRLLEEMIAASNLFGRLPNAALANAIFPAHVECLGDSYVSDRLPHLSRREIESQFKLRGVPLKLTGQDKHGLPELFTMAEINQNIFVHAARQAGVRLRSWDDVRDGAALTASLTHELERDFDLGAAGIAPLDPRTPEEGAEVLAQLSAEHGFVFYKYQLADLISHTGQLDLARAVFRTIETFLRALLERLPSETRVVVTSDHGHLEQVEFTKGHPKSLVPTWYFGPAAAETAARLRRPEAIFHLFAEQLAVPN